MQTIGPDGLQLDRRSSLTLFFFIFFGNIFEIIPRSRCRPTPAWPTRRSWPSITWVFFICVGIKHQGPLELLQELAVPARRARRRSTSW